MVWNAYYVKLDQYEYLGSRLRVGSRLYLPVTLPVVRPECPGKLFLVFQNFRSHLFKLLLGLGYLRVIGQRSPIFGPWYRETFVESVKSIGDSHGFEVILRSVDLECIFEGFWAKPPLAAIFSDYDESFG